ncbi:MAG: phage shock protein operon transcriptional activator [Candidatus Hydrogenedentes bacterium]|nr:phage shock protein operon transcriptional activator [Candidatus Hydrogenedentota bacterium]
MYSTSSRDRDRPTEPSAHEALGQSEVFLTLQEKLSLVAKVDRPVLIVGERGTGKELAARRIHFLSRRWQEPLIELNCAALAPGLIESELFGHEAGAFTGAMGRRRGCFEGADGGTLFLDELGNIPPSVQEKILRVVEYGEFRRVGSAESVRVDVRIVGATNADLIRLCDEGRFMRDLLDRLSFEVLYVPPLRERQEDIMLLANHFAARMAHELGWAGVPEFSEEVTAQFEAHPWRGNVRELKNVVERAVYQSSSRRIAQVVFDPFQSPYALLDSPLPAREADDDHGSPAVSARPPSVNAFERPFKEAVECFEKDLLFKALECARYNQRQAAKLLGLSYHQFRGVYRKYSDGPAE